MSNAVGPVGAVGSISPFVGSTCHPVGFANSTIEPSGVGGSTSPVSPVGLNSTCNQGDLNSNTAQSLAFTCSSPQCGLALIYIVDQDPDSRKLLRALDDRVVRNLIERGIRVISPEAMTVLSGKNYPSDVVQGMSDSFPVLLITTVERWSAACKGAILGEDNLYSQYCQQCNGEDIGTTDILKWVEERLAKEEREKKRSYKPPGFQKK